MSLGGEKNWGWGADRARWLGCAGARQWSRGPGAVYCPWEEEQRLWLEGVLASEIFRVENKVSFCLVLHGSFIFWLQQCSGTLYFNFSYFNFSVKAYVQPNNQICWSGPQKGVGHPCVHFFIHSFNRAPTVYLKIQAQTSQTKMPAPTGGSDGKESACNVEARVWSLHWEDPLVKGMRTHSSIPAWEIPGTEEPSGLQSIELRRAGHDWSEPSHMQACSLYSSGGNQQ